MSAQKKNILSLSLIIMLFYSACTSPVKQLSILSPNGKIEVNVANKEGVIYYGVNKEKHVILDHSKLGFIVHGLI